MRSSGRVQREKGMSGGSRDWWIVGLIMTRRAIWLAALALWTALFANTSLAQNTFGDAYLGGQLWDRYCISCHSITQRSVRNAANASGFIIRAMNRGMVPPAHEARNLTESQYNHIAAFIGIYVSAAYTPPNPVIYNTQAGTIYELPDLKFNTPLGQLNMIELVGAPEKGTVQLSIGVNNNPFARYIPTPGAFGNDTFAYAATSNAPDGGGVTSVRTVKVTIQTPFAPIIDSADELTLFVGVSQSVTEIRAQARPRATLDLLGALPPGVTFTATPIPNEPTGSMITFAGPASVGSQGDYPLTVTAVNEIGMSSKPFLLRISKRPNYLTYSPPSPIVIGSAGVPLNATGYSSAPVIYTTDNSTACPLVNGSVVPRGLGSCQITANQAGDDSHVAADPVVRTIEVIGQFQTIDFLPQASRLFVANGTFDLNPAPIVSSNLPLTYQSLTPAICSISNITVTMLAVGNCTIRASQAGTSKIAATFADQTIPLNAPLSDGLPRLVTPQLPVAISGSSYSADLLFAGTQAVTAVSVSGLPPGLTATHNGAGSVAFAGVPNGDGTYTLTIQASSPAGTSTHAVALELLSSAGYAGNVRQIEAGSSYSCAVISGGVQCWGNNFNGQLGDDSTTSSSTGRITIPPGSSVTRVSAGPDHACAVVAGGVQCWGSNASGKLGDGTTTQRLSPVIAIASGSGATDVSAAFSHTCAVVAGGVRCWGSNSAGELGMGDTMGRPTPIEVIPAGSGATAIAAGGASTCAVVAGGVRCWGSNSAGQLGNGSAVAQSTTPVQTMAAGSGVDGIAAGNGHVCAVRNGGLQCWGANTHGQLGDGTNSPSNIPVQTIAAGGGVTAVAASTFFTCVVRNGGANCFGYNLSGELGIASNTSANLPQDTIPAGSGVTGVAAGTSHACAIATGHVRCWGSDSLGQLGNVGLPQNWRVPVPVIAAGSGATMVSGGGVYCAVLSGGISCWGTLAQMLGSGSTVGSPTPVAAVASGSGASVVSVSGNHVCAVVNGAAKCWGSASHYQLGLQNGSSWSTPQQVDGLASGVAHISAGDRHTCAVVSGGIKCWGDYLYGQLGTGGFDPTLTPVDVMGAPPGTGFTQAGAGSRHSCGLQNNGNVRCWGVNSLGQLGDGTNTQRLTAVDATDVGLGNTGLATRGFRNCVVSNGGARCWGDNASFSGESQILANGSNVTAVSTDVDRHCVIVSGGVQCAGSNFFGQLGNGSTTNSEVPVSAIPANSGVTSVSTYDRQTCAVVGGGVVCWGEAAFGRLGAPSVYPYGKHLPAALQIAFAPQAIAFDPLANRAATSAAFTVSATGGASGNAVVFTSSTASICTTAGVNGSTITLTGSVGTCSITANQNGNADFLDAASVTRSFTAGSPPQVTITPSAGSNGSISPSVVQSVTVGGAISFTLTPANGFAASVGGNCSGTLSGNVYTIDPVLVSCNVMASFAAVAAGVPGAPQLSFASPMPDAAAVYFSPPAVTGSSAIAYYTAICQPGNVSFSNQISPVLVQGLTNGVSYTCNVTATNASGTGPVSANSNAVVPGTTPTVANLVSAVSRKTHGTAGDYSLPITTGIAINGNVTVEPRLIGPAHVLVLQFDAAVNSVSGITVQDAGGNPVGASTATISGNEVTVRLTGVPDLTRVTVRLPQINGGASPAAVSLGFMVGDINKSRSVNAADILAVKSRNNPMPMGADLLYDLNLSGSISASDVSLVKSRSGWMLQ